MAQNFANIGKVPELRKRILFTLSMLAVYRIGVFISVPGVNRAEMKNLIGGDAGFLGMFNMFSGGALEQLSIFALGIMPYISASIILQLLVVVVPKLEELKKEGESGQRKINQYTRYGTIVLSIVQSFFIANWLEGQGAAGGGIVNDPGWGFRLMTILTLTTGTAFIMWIGEQITERGVGNGISLIIFAGIVAAMPAGLRDLYGRRGDFELLGMLVLVAVVIGSIAIICYFERAHRRIPVQYTKRTVGRKMYGGTQSHLPLKINVSGVIPPIFASSILLFPTQIASMSEDSEWLQQLAGVLGNPTDWRYNFVYVFMIVFFTFFYTAVTFNPVDVADNLKKSGGHIPGIRPGKRTAEYIDRVLTRLTCAGAVYLSAVCVLPALLQSEMQVPFYFGGTGLLIVVGVALDTVQQIESHLITRNYDGFTGPKGPRIRGRAGARRS